jgi:hypothetical protein
MQLLLKAGLVGVFDTAGDLEFLYAHAVGEHRHSQRQQVGALLLPERQLTREELVETGCRLRDNRGHPQPGWRNW